MTNAIKVVSCGCCTNGCICHNHMDIPRGDKPGQCEAHKGWTKPQYWAEVQRQYEAMREREFRRAFTENKYGELA